MGGFDNATWQALGLVLTVVGLALSIMVWTRRGAASGLRAIAWSLIPLAAGLTGLLRLVWEIGESVVNWAAGLVFSPVVWLGLVVAAVSLLLFLVSGFLKRRSSPAGAVRPAPGAKEKRAVTGTKGGSTNARGGSTEAGSAGDDMADIEEILRKHGIS